jgi:hypothetical protein
MNIDLVPRCKICGQFMKDGLHWYDDIGGPRLIDRCDDSRIMKLKASAELNKLKKTLFEIKILLDKITWDDVESEDRSW